MRLVMPRLGKYWTIFIAAAVVLVLLALILIVMAWRTNSSNQIVSDPFTAKTIASVKFNLYYPTQLPSGYSIDKSSITEPQAGVVVMMFKKNGQPPIYMSQEIRPTTFNFGGYYNGFSNLKEKIDSRGTIAAGYINNGYTAIGSFVIGQTWVLVNTTANLSVNQTISLLNSLVLAH